MGIKIGGNLLKYFNETYLFKEHIEILKKSRKQPITKKMITCGEFSIDYIEYEKPIYIAPLGDYIYDEICELTEGRYIFNSLSLDLKRYMREKDNFFFNLSYKKYKSDIRTEIYDERAERLIKHNPTHTDEDFVNHVLQGQPIPTPTHIKAKRSASRSYKTVKGLIDSNLDKFSDFLTLTFAPGENKDSHHDFFEEYVDAKDFGECKKKFTKIMELLKKHAVRNDSDFYYVGIWELQKNGNYHFHALTSPLPNELLYDVPEWLDIDYRTGDRRHGKGIKKWIYGKSDVEKIKDVNKMKTYISKYILKSLLAVDEDEYEEYLNKKKYFASRNLTKPVILNDNTLNFDELIKSIPNNITNIFESDYLNPYNDSIIKTKKIEMEVNSNVN